MGNLLDLFVFKYNRTDFHELNLDWLISDMRTMAATLENFISMNAIKYADPIQWDITKQYEANTIAVDDTAGIAYLSTKAVPSGVSITNTDYWTPVFDLSELFAMINQNLTANIEAIGTTTATFESHMGDWILWNGGLYIVIQDDIVVGTAYVENVNVRKTTVEEQTEVIYYPNDKKLSIHGKISDYSQIVTAGDYHVYNPQRQAIEILHVE